MTAVPRLFVPFVLGVLVLPAAGRSDEADRAALALTGKGAKLERDLKTKDKPVIRADLSKTEVNDDDLALLAPLEWLETLDLSDTPITDAGLAHLRGLKRLKKLDLTRTNTFAGLSALRQKLPELKIEHPLAALAATAKDRPEAEGKALALLSRFGAEFGSDDKDAAKPVVRVTLRDAPVADVVLAALPNLPALRKLDLSLSPLGDTDPAPLGKLERLESLSLYATGAGDSALAALKDLKQLRSLNVAYDPVTDKGLADLKGLEHLQTLILFRTKVTDEGLAELKGLAKLQELSLSDTAVTDRGLETLRELSGLRLLSVSGTKVSAEGVKKLVAAIPAVKVRR
jgi:Leucine-rich repeat (LRR) protein